MHIKEENRNKLLIIEDDPEDLILLKENIQNTGISNFNLTTVENLTRAIELLASEKFDLILLDLGLPESKGLKTLAAIRKNAENIPLIVITGLVDEDIGIEAVKMGAEDYLVKGSLDPALLKRSIRYAIERFRLSSELQKSKQMQNQRIELETLDWIQKSTSSKVTEQLLGIKSLHEYSSETFEDYLKKFQIIMDKAIETRVYKVEYNIVEELRNFSDDLGFSFASPQDVVEIYSTILKKKMKTAATYEASQVYLEEGRMLLLKLMGYLLSFYRRYVPINLISNKLKNT